MFRKSLCLSALIFTVAACGPEGPAPADPSKPASSTTAMASATALPTQTTEPKKPAADEALQTFMARFLDEFLERQPTQATQAGDHRFDSKWPDISKEGDAAYREFAASKLKELSAFNDADLSLQNRIDKEILTTQLNYVLFATDELKEFDSSPVVYTSLIGDGLDPLIGREFASIEERMKNLLGRLKGVPKIVQVAKARLQNPALVFTETAIIQNQGLVSLCEKDMLASFDKVPALKADLTAAAKAAADALKDFQTFLEKDLKPRSKGDFRLGRDRFEKKLRYYLDDRVDIDTVAKNARALIEKTREEMVETSKELWPELMKGKPLPKLETLKDKKAFVKTILDEIAKDRSTNATIVKDAEEMLKSATETVRKHNLVRVPEEPCRVIEMPEYRRGISVAYCDSSGPLEQKQETFYAISPTPKDWDKKRVESYYKEYNRAMLHDLTVHEAMPGHFLQLMHNNTFSSKIRAVFQSGPFVEGWAVYGEWLMAKYGYGGAKVRIQRQKMLLRASANAVLDHDIHAGTMDEKEALSLMKDETFQEDGEAVGKWRRARLTSAQLTTYFYGFSEMMKLREKHEKEPGFTERAYHDALLGYGSPPMRHIAAIMAATMRK
ncbi:MAG: DUF885 domain-containing protein [Polyangiaceae bacterium]|nr:DUF885 domain-containing protein [Polyangiaceae bacterium]